MKDGISLVMQQANTCSILLAMTFRNLANNSPALIPEKSIPMYWAINRSDLGTWCSELQGDAVWEKLNVKCDKLLDMSFPILTPWYRNGNIKHLFQSLEYCLMYTYLKGYLISAKTLSQRANGCHNMMLCCLTQMMTSVFSKLSGLYLHVSNHLWKCQGG